MAQAEEVMTKANMAKYEQTTTARQALLETGQKTIVESSPNKTWGSGLRLTDPNALDQENWPKDSINLMGKILMNVRMNLEK